MNGPPSTPIGYGHTRGSKWDMLHFSGDEKHWELWEERFMAYMRQKKLHKIVDISHDGPIDVTKNSEVYSELVHLLDDRSLGLVMRDAKNDGREAMRILRSHYAGSGKPRVILLYSQLCSLRKTQEEDVTDYMIRAETIAASLRNTGAQFDDAFLIAIVLKGLPNDYHTFSLLTTQSEKEMTFQEFKVSLRNFEENEKATSSTDSDRVMRARMNPPPPQNRGGSRSRGSREAGRGHQKNHNGRPPTADKKVVCYHCGMEGHKSNSNRCAMNQNKFCSICQSSSHHEHQCRRKLQRSTNPAPVAAGGPNPHNSIANVARMEEMQSVVRGSFPLHDEQC